MAKPENKTEAPAAPARPKTHPNVRVLEGLLDTDKPREKKKTEKKSKKGLLRLRHWLIIAGFVGLVAVPTAATTLYMTSIAADQYHSSASFAVRSIENIGSTSDILGMFSQGTATTTVSDSYILSDYVLSERMAQDVDAEFNLDTVYAPKGLDYFFGLMSGEPIETKTEYWKRMANIYFDHASGIINLEIKAFDPETARAIAQFVLTRCELLINDLSTKAREQALSTAHRELSLAEERLGNARGELRKFRDSTQEVDPVEGARLASQLIGAMEQQLAKLNADQATARQQMAEDTPRMRVIAAQISSLQSQIELEKQRLGSGTETPATSAKTGRATNGEAVSGRIQVYEELETQREFAERAYTGSLAALEKARIDSLGKQRYLATFINPTLSEESQYPNRLMNILIVFLGGMFAWAMGTLLYYNIRDRA